MAYNTTALRQYIAGLFDQFAPNPWTLLEAAHQRRRKGELTLAVGLVRWREGLDRQAEAQDRATCRAMASTTGARCRRMSVGLGLWCGRHMHRDKGLNRARL